VTTASDQRRRGVNRAKNPQELAPAGHRSGRGSVSVLPYLLASIASTASDDAAADRKTPSGRSTG
jgi:hypothetical protein